MAGPVRQSNAVAANASQTSTVGAATITGVVAGNTLVACTIAYREGTASGNLIEAYTTTIGGSPANTWTLLLRAAYTSPANRRTEICWWIASSASSGTTVGKPDFTYEDASTQIFHHFDEWNTIATSSPLDKAISANTLTGNATAGSGSSGTLAQASEVVLAAWANRYDYTSPATFPSGYTGLQSNVGNSIIAARSCYKEVSATTAVSATFDQITQADEGAVVALITLKLGSTSLRMEIDDIDPEIEGTTGWTIWAWAGGPAAAAADKEWTAYTADVVGGALILPDAPPGSADGTTYNVSGHQPAGSLNLAWCQGVVRAAS